MKKCSILFLLILVFCSLQSYSQVPVIESVSVINNAGHVEVRWSVPASLTVDQFVIDRWANNGSDYFFITQATIPGSTFSWIDENAPSNTERCMYQVKSKISGIESAGSDAKQTILITEITYAGCELANTLRWTEYSIEDPIEKYKIWFKTDVDINYTLAATIPSNVAVIDSIKNLYWINRYSNIYTYTHNITESDRIYTYKVEPVLTTSTDQYSNHKSINAPAYSRPDIPNFNNVTVNTSSEIAISPVFSPPHLVQEIILLRSEEPSFGTIQSLQFPTSASLPLIDNNVLTEQKSYYYKINLIDTCGLEVSGTDIHRTILLEGDPDQNFKVRLNWNQYEGWAVNDYEVWRKQGEVDWEKIETLGATVTTYSDDLNLLPSKEIALKYRINAIGASYQSQSNIYQLQLDYTPLLPNAFNPLSTEIKNKTFKPISDFYNSDGYRFQIYDRWGGLLWQTTNPSEGWTGIDSNGNFYQQGVYVFHLTYKDQNDVEYQLSNTVMLIIGTN